ncbi:DUF6544 family protein [Lacimicrobium sp. SS2-24]|uniref:DUF6544 family protein n=1 Tax=Lacimicrobium sp. SS2-24 TaxID=2005569 RepID=UPI001AEFC602|nr:DUF6544 family protein [Lacimicrobium sp. SS2-24]
MLIIAIVLLLLLILLARRMADYRADRRVTEHLISTQPELPDVFHPDMVASLPEPARRYFLYTIAPDTPLYPVVDFTMTGKFALGTRQQPNYFAMRARQVLSVPQGFIWSMRASRGWMRVSGSDSHRWTRFWLMGLIPVARMGGDTDHQRSAFGRYIAEGVFWSPAALLPGPDVHWEPVDQNCARVTLTHGTLSQSVDITVAENGQPTQVCFLRWSNANPEKVYRLQPFGGKLSAFKTFAGFCLPTHVEAGNHFGSDDYFPFFIADIEQFHFPLPFKRGASGDASSPHSPSHTTSGEL